MLQCIGNCPCKPSNRWPLGKCAGMSESMEEGMGMNGDGCRGPGMSHVPESTAGGVLPSLAALSDTPTTQPAITPTPVSVDPAVSILPVTSSQSVQRCAVVRPALQSAVASVRPIASNPAIRATIVASPVSSFWTSNLPPHVQHQNDPVQVLRNGIFER
jgi:hypothetical protein